MTIEFWHVKGYYQAAKSFQVKKIEKVPETNCSLLRKAGYAKSFIAGLSSKSRSKLVWLSENDNKCAYCKKHLTVKDATWDHVIPTYRGGLNIPENKVVACEPCNNKKGGDDVGNFLASSYLLNRRFLMSILED